MTNLIPFNIVLIDLVTFALYTHYYDFEAFIHQKINDCETIFIFAGFFEKEVFLESKSQCSWLIVNHHYIGMILEVEKGIFHLLISEMFIH